MGKQKQLLYHLLIWPGLLLLDLLTNVGIGEGAIPWGSLLFRIGMYYVVSAGLYYLHLGLLIPRLLKRGHKLPYAAAVLLSLLASVLALALVYTVVAHKPLSYLGYPQYLYFATRQGLFIGAAYLTHHAVSALRLREQARAFEAASERNELAFLRSQVNPHFLFNTLNTLYGLARQNPERSAEAILQLSALMRFVLTSARKDSITAAEELECCSNYLTLMRHRLGPKFQLTVSLDATNPQLPILPLVVLPLLENAFKHGDLSDEGFVDVQVRAGQQLTLCIQNTVGQAPTEPSTRVGLQNLKRRLELSRQFHHNFNTRVENNVFIATLTLEPV